MNEQYVLDAAIRRLKARIAALEVTAARERLQRSVSVTYDNTSSGLTATDLQAAIDELEGLIGTPSLALDDLTDVTVPSPADGDVLTYDDYLAEWVNATPTTGVDALADLSDVDLTGLADTDLLQYDSGSGLWKPGSASGVADILDLPTAETDDTLVLAPDGAGGVEFRAESGGGGITVSASEPGSPTEGMVWYDTTNHLLFVYKDVGVNQATAGMGATASAEDTYGGWPASNMIDGSDATGWASSSNIPKWVKVDLGSAKLISTVRMLQTDAAQRASSYAVEYSANDLSYTTLETHSVAGADETYALSTPTSARYWRFSATLPTSSGWHIYALELIGSRWNIIA